MLEIIAQGVLTRDAGRGAYMPSITQLADGSLVACQHAGQGLASADNHIELLRTADGGQTWRNQGSIHGDDSHNDSGEEGWAYRGPDIHETPDGRWLLTATTSPVM